MEGMRCLSRIAVLLALAALAGRASPFDRHVSPVDPMAGYYPGSDPLVDLSAASMNDWNFRKLGW
jgi:hypothetical protein